MRGHAAVLVVDMLPFSTEVDVAVGLGVAMLPFPSGNLAAARAGAVRLDADVTLAMQEEGGTVAPLLRDGTFQHQFPRTTASPTATAPPDTTRAVMPPRPRTAL